MIFLCEVSCKFLSHLRSYLKAILADAWPDACDHIHRIRSVLTVHGLQGRFSHAVHGSAPAGMGQADCLMNRVHKVQRDTVRIKRHQRNTRNVGDQSVHILVIPLFPDAFSCVCFCHGPHVYRMCLIGKYHTIHIGTQNRCHAAVIFHHMRGVIVSGEAKIHCGENALAGTAMTGRKSMTHQTGFVQSRKCQIGDAVFLTDFDFRRVAVLLTDPRLLFHLLISYIVFFHSNASRIQLIWSPRILTTSKRHGIFSR